MNASYYTFPKTYLLMRLSISIADSVSVISSPFFSVSPEPPGSRLMYVADEAAGLDRGDHIVRQMHIIAKLQLNDGLLLVVQLDALDPRSRP